MVDSPTGFFAPDDCKGVDDDTGKISRQFFSDAIQALSFCQLTAGHEATVAGMAESFCVPAAVIVEAVLSHYWMYLSGPGKTFSRLEEHAAAMLVPPSDLIIEHEGE